MPSQSLSPQDQSDMIWVCRRLAAALQGEQGIVLTLTSTILAADERRWR